MGTGHVMRCLALAQAWQHSGGKAIFAMVEPLPWIREGLFSEGIEVVCVEAQAGGPDDAGCTAELARRGAAVWVIVDGNHFRPDYQQKLKAAGLQIFFIDDNAHPVHYVADLVLNPNAGAGENLYISREPYTRLLLGSRYVLLRREFEPWRDWKREIPDLGRKILITMGGTDPDNLTAQAIAALTQAGIYGMEITVVVGAGNPHLESLQRTVSQSGGFIRLRRNATDVPDLMAWADIALVAAGGTLWELLFMGCPVMSCARNAVQGAIVSQLAGEGVLQDLGPAQSLDPASLAAAIIELARSHERRSRMSALGRERVDGRGAGRICELLINREIRNLLR